MTSSDLTPAPSGPTATPASASSLVLDGTPDSRTRAATVTAVVVTRGASPYLEHALAAIQASSIVPARVVVVDASADESAGLPEDLGDVTLVRAPGARSFGVAVTAALRTASPAITTPWMWLFHDDSAPDVDALRHLLRALEHTSSVGVAGAKQVQWHNPDELVEVGFTVSRSGRRMTGVEPGELDQGQHDAREDVLAVGLAGALVRVSVWDALEGTDPTYGAFGDGLDLSRRARLAGHRVIVVPTAVVLHAQAGLNDLRRDETDDSSGPATSRPAYGGDPTFGARLRSQLYFLATSIRSWLVPFFLAAAVLAGPVRALYRVAVKQPGHALDEIWSPLWLVARTGRVLRARRRIAATTAMPRSVLTPLMATTRDVLGEHRDRRLALAARRRAEHAPSDLDRAEMRSAARKRATGLAAVVLVALASTVAALGPVLGALGEGGRIVGGAMLPAAEGVSDVWRSITSGWVRDGLGASAPADPLLTALLPGTALVGGDLQLAVNLVLLGSLVLSGGGAWFAAGAATRSVPLRFWAAVVWVAAPSLLLGVGEGRLGAVLAHAVLPWLALALARAAGVQARDTWGALRMRSAERAEERLRAKTQQRAVERARSRGPGGADVPLGRVSLAARGPEDRARGSIAALGAASLAFAVVVAGAPVLLLPGMLALVVLAMAVPRNGRSLLVVPLPAFALMAPLLVRAVATWSSGGWRILLSDPGLPLASEGAAPWRQLLALPVDPSPFFRAQGAWGVVAEAAPYVLGGLVLAAALVGLARGGPRGIAVRTMWCIVPLGLFTAVASARTAVAVGDALPVTGWPGAGASLMLLALLVAAVLGIDGLSAKATSHTFGWRQVAIGALAVTLALVPLGGLVAFGVAARSAGSPVALQALERAIVPAVGQQMQTSGRQSRVLILELRPDGSIAYQMVHDDGPQLTDSSMVVNVARLGTRPDATAELVAAVAAGSEADQAEALAELAVGAVLVPPSDELGRAQLVGRVDTVAGLQRITENESGTIWRVAPVGSLDEGAQPAWARIYAPDATGTLVVDQAVEAGPLRVDATVPAGSAERIVVLAESVAPGWHAELDGVPLRSVEGGARQSFALGSDGGHLTVGYERASRTPWLVLQGVVLVVFVLLALPVRRRRGGGR